MSLSKKNLKGNIIPLVTGSSDVLYNHDGIVDRVYDVCISRRSLYQDFVVGGIKFVSRGDILGFEEGDYIRVWFNLEGMIYKNRRIVNLIYKRFDFL